MPKENWDTQHIKYAEAEWIDKPSIFAQNAIKFFPDTGNIVDLGCGQGQDSRFFAQHGYNVVGADFSSEAIKIAKEKSKDLDFKVLDISKPLPFEDTSFDVVYSHLAVHYFNKETTELIFKELSRILKKDGVLAIFVNSVNDPEYGTGTQIEEDYFAIGNMQKRYFSQESLKHYVEGFEPLLLDEKGETYKDRAVGVSNLVQFIGRKI